MRYEFWRNLKGNGQALAKFIKDESTETCLSFEEMLCRLGGVFVGKWNELASGVKYAKVFDSVGSIVGVITEITDDAYKIIDPLIKKPNFGNLCNAVKIAQKGGLL